MAEFSAELEKILDEYSKDVQDTVDDACVSHAKKAAAELKGRSPKKKGKYARAWTSKKDGHGAIAYNRQGQLTHLLEKGHVLISYGKTRGRVPAIPHIAPVAEEQGNDFVNDVTRKIGK